MGTLHDLRFVLFDNDTRVIFASTYDGGFEQYIKDFATLVPDLIDNEFKIVKATQACEALRFGTTLHSIRARPSFFIPRIPTLRSSRYGKDSGSLRHLSSC